MLKSAHDIISSGLHKVIYTFTIKFSYFYDFSLYDIFSLSNFSLSIYLKLREHCTINCHQIIYKTFLTRLRALLDFWVFFTFGLLLYNYMRGCNQHSDRGNDGEQGERDQAQSVKDHSGKLPVIFNSGCLIIIPDLVCDDANLLENTQKFSVHAGMSKVFLVMRRINRHSE